MVQPTGRRFTSAAAANCYYNYLAQAPNRDNKRTFLSDLHLSRCKYTPFNTPPLIFANFFALKLIFCRNFAAEKEKWTRQRPKTKASGGVLLCGEKILTRIFIN